MLSPKNCCSELWQRSKQGPARGKGELFRTKYEMKETGGKYEAGLLELFGSRAAAQQFESMTDPQQMIQFIWQAPQLQVK